MQGALFFFVQKERPEEAPFGLRKNKGINKSGV
jgi:hypothetical protein